MKPFILPSFRLGVGALLGFGPLILAAPPAVRAQEAAVLTHLHSFLGLAIPFYRNSVVLGSDGNFYGTTDAGGGNNTGEVFKLAPNGALTVLHSFAASQSEPYHSALVQGSDGNFYGVSSSDGDEANGAGTIYSITPVGGYTVLYVFNATDGLAPAVPLVQGRDGNFYGVTDGGPDNVGEVYQVTPDGVFTVLHVFTGNDGFYPEAALVQGRDGNFYGTTDGAFDGSLGTVFTVTSTSGFTDLYHFGDNDGKLPNAALVEGPDGNFYGTTDNGTEAVDTGLGVRIGTVFRVTPQGEFTTLHEFSGGLDGSLPSGLVLGGDGNLYGTTTRGGLYGQDGNYSNGSPGDGTVYQLTPAGALTTLYNFTGDSYTDGLNPTGLLPAGDGSFYGTTGGDGVNAYGVVYKLSFASHPAFFTGQESIGNGFYYLPFSSGDFFGYYGFLSDPNYLYHADLGYEYVFDANDGKAGVYLYDFASSTFFYTSPSFPFPYLYDFSLNTVLYYYPDPNDPGHFTVGPRFFYDFAAKQIITK